jgi:anti-sigma factor RsiW
MPSLDNSTPPPPRRRVRSPNLTDMEREILDDNAEGFDRVVKAIDRLSARAPHPALVWTIGAAILVYVISVVAVKGGVDVGLAADATKTVLSTADAPVETVTTTTTETTTTSPPVEVPAPPVVEAPTVPAPVEE